MTCETYFDLMRDGSPDLRFWGCWGAVAIISAASFELLWSRLMGLSTLRKSIDAFAFLFFLGSYLWTVISLWEEYSALREAVTVGRIHFFSGTVTDVTPASARTRNPTVSFTIDNTRFSYYPFRLSSGFKEPLGINNPMKNGNFIRLGIVGSEI